MKNIFISMVVIIGWNHLAYCQQSLFNVPSMEITEKHKLFVQEQTTFEKNLMILNLTSTYGLGSNFEIGINAFQIDFSYPLKFRKNTDSTDIEPLAPLILFNMLKTFSITENYRIGVGTIVGRNPLQKHSSEKSLANFSYINSVLEIPKIKLLLVGGAYFGTAVYLGKKDNAGFMCGYTWNFSKKFSLMGDWIIGKHPSGLIVNGLVYNTSKKIQLSLGWQLSSPQAGNEQGVVFEFTFH